jgi:UDP-glucose 4-epimerase
MVVSDLDLKALSDEGFGGDGLDTLAFNVGTGLATSVNRLAEILEDVSGTAPGRSYEAARPGELRHSRLETGRIRGCGWDCRWTLEEGLRETYEHIAKERETTP